METFRLTLHDAGILLAANARGGSMDTITRAVAA